LNKHYIIIIIIIIAKLLVRLHCVRSAHDKTSATLRSIYLMR
jgi:hypothetical protein